MSDIALRVENLCAETQDGTSLISDIGFSVRAGQTLALLGESGSGKTVTAMSVMRLLPDAIRLRSGEVHYKGRDLFALPEQSMCKVRGSEIGFIFQEPMTAMNPVMMVGQQAMEAMRINSDAKTRAECKRRVLELFERVDLDAERVFNAGPHELSGGMRQRVMIAMALAGKPGLLIADEPTTALDVTTEKQVLELIKSLQKKMEMTMLFISHDLSVVSNIADEVIVMRSGGIVDRGATRGFFQGPRHEYSMELRRAIPGLATRGRLLSDARTLSLSKGAGSAGYGVGGEGRAEEGVRGASTSSATTHTPHPEPTRAVAALRQAQEPLVETPFDERARAEPVEAPPVNAPFDERATAPLLKVENLTVNFPIRGGLFRRVLGRVNAVDDVSFSLRRGRTLALVGESGSGKTSVAKAILRLVDASGRVTFNLASNSSDVLSLKGEKLKAYRRQTQVVFQDPFSSLNPKRTIEQTLTEGMLIHGIVKSREEMRERILELLAGVGMGADALLRYPHEFSGGQRQRICIARALSVSPSLVICDEPTSALDVLVQAQILDLFKDMQNRLGLSYLFISHDLSAVAHIADEVAVLRKGRIVEYGDAQSVLNEPQDDYTKVLLSAVPKLKN